MNHELEKLPAFSFVLGSELSSFDESRHIEFKEVKGANACGSIANCVDEYAVAFLNSTGGRILWGVRDAPKTVVGVELAPIERDRLRKVVVAKLAEIQPQLDPSRFKLLIHPVIHGGPNLVVVELEVPAGDSDKPFYTGSHACFVRVDGVKKKLSGQQLTDWILSRTNQRELNSLDPSLVQLAQRIKRVFTANGLQLAHLARFFAIREARFTITMNDLLNDVAFLRWLDEKKVSWIANTFGVRREWIDGEDRRIHEEQEYDKQPQKFFAIVSQHVDRWAFANLQALPEAYFIRWGFGPEWLAKGETRVFVLIRVPIAMLSNELTVYKYISDLVLYPWKPGRTNIQLRAWARLLFVNKGIPCFGREVSIRTGEMMETNAMFLHEIIEDFTKARRVDWSPEDYALYPNESVHAKDVDSLPEVIDFLRTHGLPYEETIL